MKTIGILALQGDFAAHEEAVTRAGAKPVLVREASQFAHIDGLILPGGESTTMLKLLRADGLMEALKKLANEKPVFGTCAGAILLAKEVTNPAQESLGVIDMTVERNAYGRQNESHIVDVSIEPEFKKRVGATTLEAVFIRAPIIRRVGATVHVLVRADGTPVLIEQGRFMAATFHPELTKSAAVHGLFVAKLNQK